MKTTFIATLLFLASCFMLQAQSPIDDGWVEVGNATYNAELKSVCFTTQDTGFAVGTGGAYLKTVDGGLNWTAFSTGYNYFFTKITFTDPATGYAIGTITENGSTGYCIKTNDGGQTWQQVFTSPNKPWDVFFFNDTIGYISAYQSVHKTTDAGLTWSTASITDAYDIYSVFFKTIDTGFVAANNDVWKSTDGGATWSSIMNNSWCKVFFTSNRVGYLVSNTNGSMRRSVDGGNTWLVTSNTLLSIATGACFKNDSMGVAWTRNNNSGMLSTTNDSSSSWTLRFNNPSYLINDVTIRPDGHFFAVGKGGLIMTSDSGINWTVVKRGPLPGDLKKICFINDSTAFAVGDGGLIVKTTDRCNSWTILPSGTQEQLVGIDIINPNTIFVIGQNSTALKSTDGGATWIPSSAGFFSGMQIKGTIEFVAPDTAYIAMEGLYKTTDGGTNWINTEPNYPYYGLSAPTKDTLYACGVNTIQRSIDQGAHWTEVNSFTNIAFSIDFINGHTGMAAYGDRRIFMTSDAGANWTEAYLNQTSYFTVMNQDDSIWYAAGRDGIMRKTTDAGNSWVTVNTFTRRALYDIAFSQDGWGYAVGQDGIILRKANIPTYSLKFDIRDEDNIAMSNVELTIGTTIYPAGVDSVGGLFSASYNYILSKPGYLSDTSTIVLLSDSTINIVMKKFHQVTFHVENVFGNAIGTAQVIFANAGTLATDAAGNVAYTEVTISNGLAWNITATNYLPQSGLVDILSDTLFTIVMGADLDAPLALVATNLGDFEFTANWANVIAADSFQLFVSDDGFITHLPGYNGLIVQGLTDVITGLMPGTPYQYRLKSVNAFGESVYSNIINVTTLAGISAEENNKNVSVYPVPASTRLFIETTIGVEGNQISIANIVGSKIPLAVTMISANLFSINIENLEAGIYLITINTASDTIVKKIIINK